VNDFEFKYLQFHQGSARQLFERLQGPFEEENLKENFENIILLMQQVHSRHRQVLVSLNFTRLFLDLICWHVFLCIYNGLMKLAAHLFFLWPIFLGVKRLLVALMFHGSMSYQLCISAALMLYYCSKKGFYLPLLKVH
jgi:hypothetical protein